MSFMYDYENVMLVPRECAVKSRADTDVSAKLGRFTFKLPVMPANMPTIMNEYVAIELAKRGYFYVMHRFGVDTVEFAKKMKSLGLFVSISVGIKQESYDVLNALKELNVVPDFVTLDLAHGHNARAKQMISHIRSMFGDDTFVIAGNVATPKGLRDLEDWGADAIKVGLGPGHVCSTSVRTGFGTRGWQLSAVAECAKVATKVVVADGGLSTSGDIAKAIHMGAHWVMSGLFFSGLTDGPGETVTVDGVEYKSYYGSASSVVRTCKTRIEGFEKMVPVTKSLSDALRELEEDLQSSVSFTGGAKLSDLRNVDHVFINPFRY